MHALSRNTKLLGGHTRFESCKAGLTPSSFATYFSDQSWWWPFLHSVCYDSSLGGCQILYCGLRRGRWETGPGLEPAASKLCQARVQQASQDEEQAGLDWPGRNRQRQKCSVNCGCEQVSRTPDQCLLMAPKTDRTTEWTTAF